MTTELDKIAYTASAAATGGRAGHARSSDGFIDLDLRPPVEMGGPGGATNPEQLFAAGYAACFQGALGVAGRGTRSTPLPPSSPARSASDRPAPCSDSR